MSAGVKLYRSLEARQLDRICTRLSERIHCQLLRYTGTVAIFTLPFPTHGSTQLYFAGICGDNESNYGSLVRVLL
jgi:hypothetical protein